MNTLEWLKSILNEDEAIAEFTVAGMYQPGYCIIPAGVSTEYLDIAGCLEETLHRIIEATDQSGVPSNAVKEETIRNVLLADKEDAGDDEEVTEIDLGYRIHGPLMTFKRLPLTAAGFEKKLYERYKLIWMLEHGITLREAFRDWNMYLSGNRRDADVQTPEETFENWKNACGFSGSLYPCLLDHGITLREAFLDWSMYLSWNRRDADIKTPEEVFENWENGCGFSGSLYPCFDKYLETEYQIEDMRLIFSEDEARCWELDQPESTEENGNESV